MMAIIATFNVKPDAEAEFESAFQELAAQVRANEPGNRLYTLARTKRAPETYRVMELYTDKDAVKAHGGADYFTAAMPRLAACCEGNATIEILDVVV